MTHSVVQLINLLVTYPVKASWWRWQHVNPHLCMPKSSLSLQLVLTLRDEWLCRKWYHIDYCCAVSKDSLVTYGYPQAKQCHTTFRPNLW